MTKETTSFIVQLLFFTALLFGIHYYILSHFFNGELYFPLWTIYAFNVVLVLIMFFVLYYISNKNNNKTLQFFLGLTLLKMGLAIVFLLPLFLGKSNHAQLEIINFFAPYFLFLAFEIFSLNKFLQKG